MQTLTDLQRMGIQVHIDDFGRGYSSLSYLQELPINAIKIDRSFIQRIDPKGMNTEIVTSIVRLAKDLGMVSIAEGVETEDQLLRLKTLGCEYGQGFYLARPMNPKAASTFIAERLHTGPILI